MVNIYTLKSWRNCAINCRHDFKGSSQWNPAHGPMKAVMMGVRDAIKVFWDPHAGAEHLSYLRKKHDPLQAPTV